MIVISTSSSTTWMCKMLIVEQHEIDFIDYVVFSKLQVDLNGFWIALTALWTCKAAFVKLVLEICFIIGHSLRRCGCHILLFLKALSFSLIAMKLSQCFWFGLWIFKMDLGLIFRFLDWVLGFGLTILLLLKLDNGGALTCGSYFLFNKHLSSVWSSFVI